VPKTTNVHNAESSDNGVPEAYYAPLDDLRNYYELMIAEMKVSYAENVVQLNTMYDQNIVGIKEENEKLKGDNDLLKIKFDLINLKVQKYEQNWLSA